MTAGRKRVDAAVPVSGGDMMLRPQGRDQKLKSMLSAFMLFMSIILLREQGACLNNKARFVQSGMWGGEHIALSVEKDLVRIEHDCARGTINQPLKIDSKGRFNASGTHTRERGGPVTEGQRPDTHPARYAGQVTGEKMVVTITLADTKETIGTFTLAHGQKPDLYKCR